MRAGQGLHFPCGTRGCWCDFYKLLSREKTFGCSPEFLLTVGDSCADLFSLHCGTFDTSRWFGLQLAALHFRAFELFV